MPIEAKSRAGLRAFLTGCFKWWLLLAVISSGAFMARAEAGVRAKDLVTIQGLRTTRLVGYGLVVGLDGTGDTYRSIVALQTATNMLKRFGINVPASRIRLKNIAAVMITAEVPPFLTEGSTVDVLVSSMGDATSLEGGTLILSPLVDESGTLFAQAQGAISVGGFNVESIGGDRIRKNYALVGRVPNGATLLKSNNNTSLSDSTITFALKDPDFTTAVRLADAINEKFGNEVAMAVNAAQIRTRIPDEFKPKITQFVSIIENLEIEPDVQARVVVNERTGTVVVGEHVTLSPVAIAHGNLRIEIQTTPVISQPAPFSQGETVVVPQTQTTVTDNKGQLLYVENSASVRDVARALNALGVSPRDIVAIFQALKEAGALKAKLIIM